MKSVLIVLSELVSTPQKALDFAVDSAKREDAPLVALYLLDKELAKGLTDKFADQGFIGERPTAELTEVIARDHRQRGYDELGRVQVKAMQEGVGYEPLIETIETNELVEVALKMIEERGCGLAVITRRKPSTFGRYFSIVPADQLLKTAPCEVRVFDEEAEEENGEQVEQ